MQNVNFTSWVDRQRLDPNRFEKKEEQWRVTIRAFPAIDHALQSETEGISSLGRTRTPGPGCQPPFVTDCCVYATLQALARHHSTQLSSYREQFHAIQRLLSWKRSALGRCWPQQSVDRLITFTAWKNHFLSGPASGPYHWLLPSACRLGKHFFRAHKNLCFVVDFFLLFFTSQLIDEKVFLASQFRCQCRSIMKQNSVDALWTFPPAKTEFVNLIRRPPCLDIACLFFCVYGFFFSINFLQ